MNLQVHKDTDVMYLIGHLQERKHGEMISVLGNSINTQSETNPA